MNNRLDWNEIQRVYDNQGLSIRKLANLFDISPTSIEKAIKRGDFRSRTKFEATLQRRKNFIESLDISLDEKSLLEVGTHEFCSACRQVLTKELFGLNQTYCKSCNVVSAKKYYKANATIHKADAVIRKKKALFSTRKKLANILQSGCVDCGNKNILVLDFDHIDWKSKHTEVPRMVQLGFSWTKIMEEIEKCKIRCANCHRIKTAQEQNSWRLSYL